MAARNCTLPIALTIAGSDSGGGAGIQADLKTFAALGVHGVTAITCITAQNPKGVRGIQACSPKMVRLQLEAIFDELKPKAAKTGMLFSAAIISEVAAVLEERGFRNLVLDPVMIATSGARLLKESAVKVLTSKLLPLCKVLTPNLDEAALLTGRKLESVEDLRWAARKLHERHGCAVLAKGGHLRGLTQAVDIFFDGNQELLLSAPFVRGAGTHGTGCTYSSAITACLAREMSLQAAVREAKHFITQAISTQHRIGGYHVLNFSGGKRG